MSILAWLAGDYAVGAGWVASGSLVAVWNAVIRLAFYYLIIVLLVEIRELTTSLESKVLQRAAALKDETAERQRLEHELLDVSERERRRLGYDLHDGLCQHLTGTALAIEVLREKLSRKNAPEAMEAAKAVQLVQEGIALSHNLAKSLQPVELQESGLMPALQEFAASTTSLFNIDCRFECDSPVLIPNLAVADHFYRIAQEAVANAIRHGRATNIVIALDLNDENTILRIEDNGIGITKPPTNDRMGLRIMAQRAKLIGALLDIHNGAKGGTKILCSLQHAVVT